MKWETHRSVVRRINTQVRNPFPLQPLMDGSVAPDEDRKPYERHHALPPEETRHRIWQAILTARQHWLRDDRTNSAFFFGVASHFAADCLVPSYGHDPDSAASVQAASVQEDLAHLERQFVPPSLPIPDLADEPMAEAALREFLDGLDTQSDLSRVGAGEYLGKRRGVLHECLLRLAWAVTEDAVPEAAIAQLEGEVQRQLKSACDDFLRLRPAIVEQASHQARGQASRSFADMVARRRLRIRIARAVILHRGTPHAVGLVCSRSMEKFKDSTIASTAYRGWAARYEQSRNRLQDRADSFRRSEWFRIPSQRTSGWPDAVVAPHKEAITKVLAADEVMAEHSLAVLKTNLIRQCVDSFPADWRGTLRYKIVANEGGALVYLLPWIVLGTASLFVPLFAPAIAFAPFILVPLFVLCGRHARKAVNSWTELTEYADEVGD